MSPYQQRAFPPKDSSPSTPIPPLPRAQMAGKKGVLWERPKSWQVGLGQGLAEEERTKLLYSCKTFRLRMYHNLNHKKTDCCYVGENPDLAKLPFAHTCSHRSCRSPRRHSPPKSPSLPSCLIPSPRQNPLRPQRPRKPVFSLNCNTMHRPP